MTAYVQDTFCGRNRFLALFVDKKSVIAAHYIVMTTRKNTFIYIANLIKSQQIKTSGNMIFKKSESKDRTEDCHN